MPLRFIILRAARTPEGTPSRGEGEGVGGGVGAALAGEIGEEECAFAAGRGGGGFGDEQFIRIDLAFFGGGDFGLAEGVAEPLEAATGAEHAAEDAPLAGDGVAHRVDAPAR